MGYSRWTGLCEWVVQGLQHHVTMCWPISEFKATIVTVFTVFRTTSGAHEYNVFHLREETSSGHYFLPPINKNVAIWSHWGSREGERHGLWLAAMCCHENVEKRMHVWPSISLYHKGRCRRKAKMMMGGWAGVRLQNAMFRAKRKGRGYNLRAALTCLAHWQKLSVVLTPVVTVFGKLTGGWPQVWPRMSTAIYQAMLCSWFPVSWLIDRLMNRSLPRERLLQGRHSHHFPASMDFIIFTIWNVPHRLSLVPAYGTILEGYGNLRKWGIDEEVGHKGRALMGLPISLFLVHHQVKQPPPPIILQS